MSKSDPALDITHLEGPLGQRVYTALRRSILDMTLEPGAILRKGALCEQLGVSRSPVAEALGRLSSDGLVDIIPQSATRVSQFSMAELLEEDFLREAVETAAVARVAEDHTPDQLLRLSRNLRLQGLLVEDADFQGFFEADLEFHEMILGFTGFPKVTLVAEEMTLQLRRARKLILPEPGRPAEAVAEHQIILAAIEAKDSRAARTAMSRHLRQLIKRIKPLERQHPDYFRAT
ncbi:HTH-type transcriptional repressor RspR [Antarctobacter heliothermus]|uniref:HTH-type transcriptional repressor RspR n=1 Tax=Antarctobacter heliothermus TaxID=74033 RepID=A0A222DZK4_9RHOB|nr:GntR family transcriptional regulator [Antarctobacter heliothermus]ASP19343.1 HTH-type transcriptional repressor RspR [Antarctobacter heliothermus]MBT55553.1 GntR family transcriptional regulator [Mameliella sp.]|tara:strand:+ start:340 stop:1038 length:699 start_codon:yes stop_codon:yes gene_type:complete